MNEYSRLFRVTYKKRLGGHPDHYVHESVIVAANNATDVKMPMFEIVSVGEVDIDKLPSIVCYEK